MSVLLINVGRAEQYPGAEALSAPNLALGYLAATLLEAGFETHTADLFFDPITEDELIAAIPAYLAVMAFRPILPYAFGVAAGAMILLVMSEMIPESRVNESQRLGSAVAGMSGFLVMMMLQNILIF